MRLSNVEPLNKIDNFFQAYFSATVLFLQIGQGTGYTQFVAINEVFLFFSSSASDLGNHAPGTDVMLYFGG